MFGYHPNNTQMQDILPLLVPNEQTHSIHAGKSMLYKIDS
jgi:hypothetical protein